MLANVPVTGVEYVVVLVFVVVTLFVLLKAFAEHSGPNGLMEVVLMVVGGLLGLYIAGALGFFR